MAHQNEYPLSQSQYGIYTECTQNPENNLYQICYLFHINGKADMVRLQVAVRQAIDAHPSLHCRIRLDDNGTPVQYIDDNETLDIVTSRVDDIDKVRNSLFQPVQLIGDSLVYFQLLEAPDATYVYMQLHHIIADGGTLTILWRDIERAYRGESLPVEQLSALDYSREELSWRESEAWQEDQQWYQENFTCNDVDTSLVPDMEEKVFRSERLKMPVALVPSTVKAFCRANGIGQSVFFTSAYALLLSRYTGDEEVLFSTIWHGRGDKRLADSTGMFIGTMPAWYHIGQEMTVGDLLRQGVTTVVESRQHYRYSFADFCTDKGVHSNQIFAFQGNLFKNMTFDGMAVTEEQLSCNVSTEPITVELFEKEDHYMLYITYHAHRYSETMMREFARSYEHLAKQMTDIELPLKTISNTSDTQVKQLDSFNDTYSEYDDTQTVVSLFETQAARHPEKTAVVYQERRYTYREVDDISNRLASAITAKGLGKEDVVSILIPRSEWMVIASMGVLKAGCAYQPLDPTYPQERLNFMMKDANARLLIADEKLRDIVNEYEGETLMTKDIMTLPECTTAPETNRVMPSDLFILLYTSGSTGIPKGCQLEHRNVAAFCHTNKVIQEVCEDSVIGAYASYGFDASVMELYSALTAGATLHIIPEEIRLDLVALNDYYERNGVTHAFMTTQVGFQFASNFDTRSLKYLLTGGEKLSSITPPEHYSLINGYGPTESVCYVTYFKVDRLLGNIPIGKAVPNMKCYIVDKNGQRLPVGASGELWVSGPQVSRGYLNRPEKTAEVYIRNPFVNESSSYSRVYRTGDIVRYLPDGNIQFVGRKDGQVKIRGFRIELKEVEAVIRQYPGISDVTVQVFDETGGGKFIAAYIVSDETVDVTALNQFIMEEKPPYMVPAVTMQIERIPLNQNQKVDKKALPRPEKKHASATPQEEPAKMNVLEKEIHSAVAAIVGHEDFGITTPLGFAGLTSIMSIKLAIQMNKLFGIELNTKTLAKSGTVQSIENVILEQWMQVGGNDKAAKPQEKQRQQEPANGSIPLSHAQTGVYIDCMKQPTSTIYNIPMLITFPLNTDTGKLATCLKTLVKAHPIMTVHFSSKGSEIVQITDSSQPVEVAEINKTEQQLDSYKHEFVKPFNLKQGPLYRFEIVKTEQRVAMLADIHHLIIDGGSMDVFLNQLCDLMNGKEIEAEDQSYADFVAAEKVAEAGRDYQAARDFFQRQLGTVEGVTEVSSDLTNPKEQGENKEVVCTFDLAAAESFCRRQNITPAHLTLAAVFYALARFTNNEQLCISTISNGRSNLRIRNTVGMFVNTLALSSTITDEPVMSFIEKTSRDFDETLSHEFYPFAQIAADYDLKAEIMFAYQIGVLDSYVCQGTALSIESLEVDTPKFRIAFFIREHEGQPAICIEYDNGRYSHELMQNLAQSVSNAITAFIRQPKAPLLQVSLLNHTQTAHLDSFNQTDVPYDDTQTIVSLFLRQAALTPDSQCVVYHDRRYTYREVNELSNRIACYIGKKGLGAEDVVSILIPRCEWMVIASIGVLKAGCAYQPLDPSYPAERLNFMMKDANARLLIADEALRSVVNEYQGETLLTKDITTLSDNTVPRAQLSVAPSSLFILLYTSGSTGLPKGCQLEHRNVVAFCHWYQREFELTADSHVAAYASYGFDACMMDIYPAITCGACVYIIGEDIRLNLPDLNDYFNANTITHSFITTQVGYQFATNVDNHSLQFFAVGGEKLSALNPPKNYKMYNGYGPTECTIFTTRYWVKDYELDIPIGKPLDNLRLYIVDKQFNRLPPGAAGELWVCGPQVSRGYLNRPEKTAEVYINNPFEHEESRFSRIYRTGDIVRYLPDGNIQFVGRRDGQVKIRGFRIELKEVEAVIRQYPGISDATVQAFDYENGGKYIAAYIVSKETIDIKVLNKFIGQQKPSYMIPAATMQIDAIPLNQNQKVNRKALPAPVIQASGRDYVAPVNNMERLFCDIFADILSLDKVGAVDNFFELGGTSLMVTRVIIAADKHGHHIAYGDIFTHPTPRLLAQFVGGTAPTNDTPANDDSDFDYKPIDIVLTKNTLDNFKNGQRQAIGTVLLTGATGYLGIHVLKELIDRDDVPAIWCMVRAENEEKGERRLKQLLFYYFGRNYKELFGNRLRITLGDVTREITVDDKIDTVFNCAAVVKHFSKGTEIEDVNIGGAMNCVKFCVATGARLIHISTYSTAGLSVNGTPPAGTIQTEQNLYYGQYMENQYVHSKFIAERVVLDAVALHGLNGKVMRVGNLAPRSNDGEFQINFQTNSAMGRIRVFKMLGCYPYEMADDPMEFSPINEVAQSIVLLAQAPRDCTLFHPFNNHHVFFGDVLTELGKIGDTPRQVEAQEFSQALERAKEDPEKAKRLSSLIAYEDLSHGQQSFEIPTSNQYTTQVLYRMGFRWSVTSWDYVGQFLKAIDGMGFFDV